MKAFVLAAGLGTRLRPWTLTHPKALVPVGGVPMLERVVRRLVEQGFDDIVVNVHHFADQIESFIAQTDMGARRIRISDERGRLLETGGAILHASDMLCGDTEPFLVHNVDILSDVDLAALMASHMEGEAESTLLVSHRESSRRLVFSADMRLRGWHGVADDMWKPAGCVSGPTDCELAFSGIYVMSPALVDKMQMLGFSGRFSVIDFFLAACGDNAIYGHDAGSPEIIDIGKPATLERACEIFG